MCTDHDHWVRQSALGFGAALWAGAARPRVGGRPGCERNPSGAVAAAALAIGALLLGNASAASIELPASAVAAVRGLGQLAGFHDFGVAVVDESFTHEFDWLNDSAEVLIVEEVFSSCDCLRIEAFPRVIEPGHQETLSLSIHPDAAGTMDWFVYAQLAGSDEQLVFWLSGRIEETSPVAVAAELLVTAEDLLAKPANSPEPVFVDVRGHDLHRLGRIPGSINLPLFTVKARGFLRPRRLVLLNEGHHSADLLEEARRLKELRFVDISVLEGGFRAWQQAGGPVEGEEITLAALATLTSAQFHRARSDPGWLVLGAQTNPGPAVGGPLPLAGTLSLDPARFSLGLSAALERQPATRRVLLLTAAGENYDAIEAALTGFHGPPVFYLAGGAAGYAHLLDQELAQKNRQQLSVSTDARGRGGAGRSTSASNRSTGCGGCGGHR